MERMASWMWANPTGCKADTRRSGRSSLGPGKDTSQSAHSRVKAFSFWEGLHKNVTPLKTDKRRATRMVSEQEIWAKTGWTGAEILERAGAERLWGLSPGAYLNHHTWRKGITVPTSFIAMTKTRVWQATRKVGVRQWEHDLGQPWNKKNSSVTATEIRTPQSSSLSEKPAFSQDSSTSEVSPQLLPARSPLHRQQTEVPARPRSCSICSRRLLLILRHPREQQRQEWRTKPWRKYLDSILGNAEGGGLAETCNK